MLDICPNEWGHKYYVCWGCISEDDGQIERITYMPEWSNHDLDLCYYSTPEIRRLADITASNFYRDEILNDPEVDHVDAIMSGVALRRAIWATNGGWDGIAHFAPDEDGNREAFNINGETSDKPPTKDVYGLEILRAADRLEGDYPGIRHAYYVDHLATPATIALYDPANHQIEVVDKVPVYKDIKREHIAIMDKRLNLRLAARRKQSLDPDGDKGGWSR